ncbi:Chorion peroxidase [Nymphon striatum]|nr:Chorion peroxidase [Nymphon striatum]
MTDCESDFSDPEIEEFRNLRIRDRPQGYKNSIVIRPIPSRTWLILCIIWSPVVGQIIPSGTTYQSGTIGDLSKAKEFAELFESWRAKEYYIWKTLAIDGISTQLGAHHQLNKLNNDGNKTMFSAFFHLDTIYNKTTDPNILDNGINAIEEETYPSCDVCSENDAYRSMDGFCNNLEHCVWGAAYTTLRRLLPPDYAAKGGLKTLNDNENAVFLSRQFFRDDKKDVHKSWILSQFATHFGQFLSHDLIATPVVTVINDEGKPIEIDCCQFRTEFKECEPIVLLKEDICISFVRSAPGIVDRNKKYSYSNREQMNQVTAYVDGSQIYGSSDASRDLLYTTTGDVRTNVVFPNMLLHTMFLREHNRIATEIKKLRSNWNGKKIFEETRRIIGAILQRITYEEYLEKIIGAKMKTRYGLSLNGGTAYDKTLDPSIINSFSTVAFRFGHSQISSMFTAHHSDGSTEECLPLNSSFFNPDLFYENSGSKIPSCAAGLTKERAQEVDDRFTFDVNGFLFKSRFFPQRRNHLEKGIYLPAINIQRGRDHGIPRYGKWREFISTYDQVSDVISATSTQFLNPFYSNSNYELGDLYTVGLFENHYEDASMGHTFATIIARQFLNLRDGDRFFFTHTNTKQGFTNTQIAAVRKVTMSQIICRNSGMSGGQKLAPDAFVTSDRPNIWPNNEVTCSEILKDYPDIADFINGRT